MRALCADAQMARGNGAMLAPYINQEDSMTQKPTMTDIPTLRLHARKHAERGAVTEGYSADLSEVIKQLNEALATEIVCVLRYRRHHFMARGIHAKSIAAEFLAHSNEEQGHADRIAARIVQLGGAPDFAPDGLTQRSHAEYVEGETLADMIRENLVAERIAIDSYRDMVRFLGNDDPTTSDMLKEILAVEEEHADDMADMLDGLPSQKNI
jgi:bacterioferritin